MTTLFNAKTTEEIRTCFDRGDNIETSHCGWCPFSYHCSRNNIDIALYLIDNGCDITYSSYIVNNGLIVACGEGHYALVKKLLAIEKVYALINTVMKGFSPLTITCARGHTDVFDLLVSYGADITIRTKFNQTPLITACENNKIDIVDRLLPLLTFEEINASDYSGCTALFYCKTVSVLDRLYLHGCNLHHRNNDRCTRIKRL